MQSRITTGEKSGKKEGLGFNGFDRQTRTLGKADSGGTHGGFNTSGGARAEQSKRTQKKGTLSCLGRR